ncbi:ABC transporter permease [Roseibium sp.]|uniref:ABC transporter permease n=1 Tax=Roseibium sp. TaxID=1936156 RepID=UPI003B51E456
MAIAAATKPRERMNLAFAANRQFWLLMINLVVIGLIGYFRPEAFLSWTNFKAILTLMSYDLLLAVAMTVVLIVRGLDLSVGSVLALTSVVLAMLLKDGTPVYLALILSLGVALLCGAINSVLIVKVGLLPFLVTLAMMTAARGVATVLTTGQYVSFPYAARWFSKFAREEIRIPIGDMVYGFPNMLLITLAVTGLFGLLLWRWAPMRGFFYLGESPEAAKLSGLKVDRIAISAYVLAAAFVWVAAVLMTSANKIGYANYGIGAELRALAAAVIGGASLSGGAGSVLGTFLGVLLLALIGNGFVLLNGDPNWQQATVGAVLILAVAIDAIRRARGGDA